MFPSSSSPLGAPRIDPAGPVFSADTESPVFSHGFTRVQRGGGRGGGGGHGGAAAGGAAGTSADSSFLATGMTSVASLRPAPARVPVEDTAGILVGPSGLRVPRAFRGRGGAFAKIWGDNEVEEFRKALGPERLPDQARAAAFGRDIPGGVGGGRFL